MAEPTTEELMQKVLTTSADHLREDAKHLLDLADSMDGQYSMLLLPEATKALRRSIGKCSWISGPGSREASLRGERWKDMAEFLKVAWETQGIAFEEAT